MSFLGKFISVFTAVTIDQDSGILLQNEEAPAWYVRRIRLWNFLEPFAVYGAIMLVVWGSMLDPAVWWVKPCLGALVVWCLIITPFVHYPFEKDLFLTESQRNRGVWFYFFECRGLGSPIRYYLSVDGEPPQIRSHYKTIVGVTLFLDLLFVSAFITFNEDVRQRFGASMGDTVGQNILFLVWMLFLIDAGLVLLAYPWMLRLDNFHKSLRFIAAFVLLVTVMAVVGNLLFHLNEDALREGFKDNPYMSLRGARAIERLKGLNAFAVGGQWSGYVFWGFLQELLFLGVFATQINRAFDIGRSRLHVLLACLCTATLFGLIHLPNFWLGLVTFLGGLFGALCFMQCPNLFALGIVHGYGGTMMNKLLPINFSVGPSEVAR